MHETLNNPNPPSSISISAIGMKRSGLWSFKNVNAMNRPMAREPASPIRRRLGEALNHKYPRIHTIMISRICLKYGSISYDLNSTYVDTSVTTERVPQRPSTPSEQLVTLILAHMSMTIRIPYTTGFSVIILSGMNASSNV